MIPLFAIGVFTGFTLSQTGLVVHWWRTRPSRWAHRAGINGLGAIVTGLATVIFLVSKFAEGAWVVVVAVPTFFFLFTRIHAYYQQAAAELGIGTIPGRPIGKRTLVIVPVTSVSRLTEHAIAEAMSIGQEVVAVSVAVDLEDEGRSETEELKQSWADWNPGPELRILHTEFTSVVDPIVAFIDEAREQSDQQIVVLIPVVIPTRLRYRILHNQIDLVLSAALRSRTDVVVARVCMPLAELSSEIPQPEVSGSSDQT
jgi:hypothetical protein